MTAKIRRKIEIGEAANDYNIFYVTLHSKQIRWKMVKRFVLSFVLTVLVGCFAHAQVDHPLFQMAYYPVDRTLHQCLQNYMDDFPESDLRDLYKSFFQDYFGPEHLITDSMGAVNYINYEMAHADSADWERPLFYYGTGLLGRYVRVDINYVRSGIVPMAVFVSALLRSAKQDRENTFQTTEGLEYWKAFWNRAVADIRQLDPLPGNLEADSAAIAQTLASGNYAVHHSKRFNSTYRQHYRIIRIDIFENEILPLIHKHSPTK